MQAVVATQIEQWVLHLEGLSKSYSGNILFEGLDLEIRPGATIHLQGPNGAGKTQLMLVIAGLVDADAGRILFRGRNEVLFDKLHPDTRARFVRYVPYLPGSIAEMPMDRALLVLTRHLHPFSLHSQSAAATKVTLGLASELRAICDDRIEFERPLANYSIGQQKRIMAAASLGVEPYPLLAMIDEPLAGLDSQGIARVLDLMLEAKARGIALLISEHRKEILDLGFDRVLRLPYRAADDAPTATIAMKSDVTMALSTTHAEPVLKITETIAGYAGNPVHCSSLTVAPGELVVIQGSNGSGKTSFVRGLLGYTGTVLSGHIEFDRRPVLSLRSIQETNALRYLSQKRDLFPDLTVQESIIVAGRGHRNNMSIEITDIVRLLGPGKRVRHLSSGGRALLGLAQALAAEPRLLILDEPASNTDVANRQRVWDLLRQVCLRGRTGVLVIEHDAIPGMASAVYQVMQSGPTAALVRV